MPLDAAPPDHPALRLAAPGAAGRRPGGRRARPGGRAALGPRLAALIACAAAGGLAGCGSSGGGLKVGSHTKVLDADTLAQLVSLAPDGSSVGFATSTPLLDTVAAGDVIVAPVSATTPVGLIGRVTAVTRSGGVTLTTAPAGIADLFERATITYHHDLSTADLAPGSLHQGLHPEDTGSVGGSLVFGVNDLVLYDVDGMSDTTNDQVRLSGNVSLSASLDLTLDVQNFQLKTASVSLSGTEAASLDAVVDGAYSFDESKEFTAFTFAPITIYVGTVPLVFVPDLRIKFGVKGSLAVSLETGATQTASFKAGVGYQNGAWGPITDAQVSAELNPPTIDGKLTIRTYAGPQFNLLLYGSVGPHVDLSGYLALTGDTNANPCWGLHGGVDADLGMKVEVLGSKLTDYSVTVNLVDQALATGPCLPTLPPDTFWSKTYDEPTLGPESARVAPTVDGGAVVIARSADIVFKIDAKGNVLWQRQFTNFHDVRDVAVLDDGTYVVTGTAAGGWLARLDSAGDFVWSRRYTADDGTLLEATALVAAADGDFVVAGNATSVADGDQDVWVLRTDATGTPVWSERLHGHGRDAAEAARAAANGDVVVVGTNGDDQGAAVAVASDGSLTWQWQYGGLATVQSLYAVAQAPGDGWLFAGTIQEETSTHGWFLRANGDGSLKNGVFGSSQYYPGDSTQADFSQIAARAVAGSPANDDSYYGVGAIWDGVSTTTSRFWGFKLALGQDGTATMIWSRAFDAADDDEGYGVAPLTDTTLVLSGTSKSLGGSALGSIWLLRTQQNGAITFPATSGVTVTSLTGAMFQTTSEEAPDGGPAPVPVVSTATSLDPAPVPVTAVDDPLTLLTTTLAVQSLAP